MLTKGSRVDAIYGHSPAERTDDRIVADADRWLDRIAFATKTFSGPGFNMKTSLTSAALLAALPLGLAQHHYGPPDPGPHSGGPWDGSWPAGPHPTSWEGHSRPGASSTATATSAAPSASASGGSGSSPQSCTPLTTDDIEAMGNNTLFTRWRPQSHFIAPAGWMNDPYVTN
ncbi:hypothetical protein LTR10_003138 [Elasticomyces elasticus]|nr:hypothetical protein LTR10_003138 [Elasticomyces elasticus]